jgi:hypothetical protein
LRKMELTKADLAALGFRLLVDAISPVLLFHKMFSKKLLKHKAFSGLTEVAGNAGVTQEQKL